MPYAVVDFETTGVVPERNDRAIEVGVVLLEESGKIELEWTTLLNPRRDIGATHIHGIRAADVIDAPEFGDIADDLLDLMAGRTVVAHNATFDMRFLHAELERAGYSISERPSALCSMKWAGRLIGAAKLEHCCEALGISLVDAHSALADARATAELLNHLSARGASTRSWRSEAERSRAFEWPHRQGRNGVARLVARGGAESRSISWLETVLNAAWIPGASEDEANYLLTLNKALLDRSISLTEGRELAEVARLAGLSGETVQRLHRDYLGSIAREALADGKITEPERHDLESVASALGLNSLDVDTALESTSLQTGPPANGTSFQLNRGDRVVFTGEMRRSRDDWVAEIAQAGLVSGGVTKSTKLLVAADPDSMSGKASKARHYGVPIVDEAGFERLFAEYVNGPVIPIDEVAPALSPLSAPGSASPFDVFLPHSNPTEESQPHGIGHARIEAAAKTMVGYAMSHNRIPVVTSIAVHGLDPSLNDIEVWVEVTERDNVLNLPVQFRAGVSAEGTAEIPEVSVRLDPAKMAGIEERRPGKLRIVAAHGERTLASQEIEIDVLAARQWLRDPQNANTSYEMLAAHVMPNDPALLPVLDRARERLRSATGSANTDGYQTDSNRVDAIVEAIYETLREGGIHYSNPPASWDSVGQKVRTPGDVINGHVGTCLDTTALLAAALEHVGINSVVFVVEGHAFLGYYREEVSTGIIATSELGALRNAVDRGLVRVIETTALTKEGADGVFSNASVHRTPVRSYLSEDLSRAYAAIDILAARSNRVYPLPAVSHVMSGDVVVTEYVPTAHSGAFRSVEPRTRVSDGRETQEAPPRVQKWKNALLDLSLRNRLINFSTRTAIELAVPDGGLSAIEDRLNAGQSITLLPSDEISSVDRERGIRFGNQLPQDALARLFDDQNSLFTDVASEGYKTRLRNLAAKAKAITEETGANNLYLAVGSLRWNLDGRSLSSPLILIPIDLVAGRSLHRIVIDESGTSTPNYCLIEKLRQVHGMKIPGLENPVEDDHGINLDHAFSAVREALAEYGLPYYVEESLDIAILQFAKYRLWRDLDESWPELAKAPLVRHLIETPTDPFLDPVEWAESDLGTLDEIDAQCPIPADSSQLEAIASATAGNTFVLEGPPGTGKSQTITNLLARAVAEGKKVLFVAEKRAALDVVSDRLDSIGMGVFALDLHDKNAKPTAVRQQIRRALDHSVAVDQAGLNASRETLRSSRRRLARYAEHLHRANNVGHSFYSARSQELAFGDTDRALTIDPEWVVGAADDDVRTVSNVLELLPDVADLARPRRQHPWGFIRERANSNVTPREIAAAASTVSESLTSLRGAGAVEAYVSRIEAPSEFESLLSVVSSRPIPLQILDYARTREWLDASAAYRARLDAFIASPPPGVSEADPSILDLPLGQIRADVQAASASGFFGRKKRVAAAMAPVTSLLRDGVRIKPKEALAYVDHVVAARAAADALAPAASGVPGLTTPSYWNPFHPSARTHVGNELRWIGWLSGLIGSDSAFARATREYVASGSYPSAEVVAHVNRLTLAVDHLRTVVGTLDSSVASWIDGSTFVEVWSSTESERSRDAERGAARWLALTDQVQVLREVGLNAAVEQILDGTVTADELSGAFSLGLARASVIERSNETGLSSFDPQSHVKTVERFSAALRTTRELLKAEVPHKVLERRTFDVSTARGQVGALQRELGAKRGLKVRELLLKYGELITEVMPCVLVSPDSVARFFPVGSQLFDLVVFDEASQIRVADAIGALGRARAALIVGDSKQMPPTSVAETTFDDDAADTIDDLVPPDEESILVEAVQARIRRQWLTWHYRSRNESLIAFSNSHYYENKLASFPTPTPERAVDSGIRLVRVNGEFIRERGASYRTNPVEAQAIVDDVVRRFEQSPGRMPSIGVVTFNQQQREYIEGLLRDTHLDRILDALDGRNGEGLLVKNLENVQGDERDVILFSTAFSKNQSGRLPLNFGPLNNAGGERRLNVAVTRARTEVTIFSSFDPTDLRADDTQSVGVKHLRAYLDLAAHGTKILTSKNGNTPVIDRHRDSIVERLRSQGLHVEPDLGLSSFKVDLAIFDPSNPEVPVVAVLLDGPGWARRRTTGDRDALPVTVLGDLMQWPRIERVWMPEWITDSDAVVERLVAVARGSHRSETQEIEEMATEIVVQELVSVQPIPAEMKIAGSTASCVEVTEPPVNEAPVPRDSRQTYFVPCEVLPEGERFILDALPDRGARELVWRAASRFVEHEGPIQEERLARLTAASFDLTRLNAKRISSILAAVPRGQRDKYGFVWPAGRDHGDELAVRAAAPGEQRAMTEVHPREIIAAVEQLVREAWAIGEDELHRDVLTLYGWKRRTEAALEPVRAAIELARREGRIVIDVEGTVSIGSTPSMR